MRAGRGIVRTCVAASGWWWRCIFDGVASTSYYCIVGIVAKDDPKIYRVATAACSSTCVEQRAAFDAICFASQMAKPNVFFLCSLVNDEPSSSQFCDGVGCSQVPTYSFRESYFLRAQNNFMVARTLLCTRNY
jgi:hypothetical protein